MQLIHDLVITQEFIDYRNEYKPKFEAGGRPESVRLMHADCLLLEWHLTTNGHAQTSNTMSYDAIIPGYNRVEIKSVSNGGSVTIGQWTRRQDFDNYLFFRFAVPRTAPLEIGDTVTINIVQIEAKDSVEMRCRESNFNTKGKPLMYYVWAQDGKIAKPDVNSSMYNTEESVYTKPMFA